LVGYLLRTGWFSARARVTPYRVFFLTRTRLCITHAFSRFGLPLRFSVYAPFRFALCAVFRTFASHLAQRTVARVSTLRFASGCVRFAFSPVLTHFTQRFHGFTTPRTGYGLPHGLFTGHRHTIGYLSFAFGYLAFPFTFTGFVTCWLYTAVLSLRFTHFAARTFTALHGCFPGSLRTVYIFGLLVTSFSLVLARTYGFFSSVLHAFTLRYHCWLLRYTWFGRSRLDSYALYSAQLPRSSRFTTNTTLPGYIYYLRLLHTQVAWFTCTHVSAAHLPLVHTLYTRSLVYTRSFHCVWLHCFHVHYGLHTKILRSGFVHACVSCTICVTARCPLRLRTGLHAPLAVAVTPRSRTHAFAARFLRFWVLSRFTKTPHEHADAFTHTSRAAFAFLRFARSVQPAVHFTRFA